jgi:hypothetical protein
MVRYMAPYRTSHRLELFHMYSFARLTDIAICSRENYDINRSTLSKRTIPAKEPEVRNAVAASEIGSSGRQMEWLGLMEIYSKQCV